MENIVIEVMNNFGYIGIFFLIMIENLFPPIPSEVILTFGGFMTLESSMTIAGVIISSTLGSFIGAVILYYIGKILNKNRLIKIVESRHGKLLRIKARDIEKADNWFYTKGNITVFFCRFIPVVRSLISIPAGMSSMPFVKFSVYTIIGSLIWNSILICVGVFAGNKKDMIINIIDKSSNVILILIAIFIFIFAYRFYKNKKEVKK